MLTDNKGRQLGFADHSRYLIIVSFNYQLERHRRQNAWHLRLLISFFLECDAAIDSLSGRKYKLVLI